MKKIVIILLSLLSLNAYANHDIKYIDEKDGFYIVYLTESSIPLEVSNNVGKLIGYSSMMFVTLKDGYYCFYNPNGKWIGSISSTRCGEIVRVKDETLVTKKDGYIITWNRNGRKISEVSSR